MNQELIQLNGQLVNDEGAEWDYTQGKFKSKERACITYIEKAL